MSEDHVPASTSPSAEKMLVVLCTFNERPNLPSMVERIHGALPGAQILVVDDNSPDGTGEWARETATSCDYLHVLIREDERGLGSALRAGMQWAMQRDFDWLLNLDADHSHDPDDLPRLLATATQGSDPLDCVVGTRYARGGHIEGWSWHRRWMSRSVNRFATSILRLPVSDCSGSLRCYRISRLRSMELESLRSNGYAIFEEILLRLKRAGASFGEAPITFHERQAGESKLTLPEAMRSAIQIVKLAISR